jgi:thiosulfate/3-mercaptopyruvate sulfurtransferase
MVRNWLVAGTLALSAMVPMAAFAAQPLVDLAWLKSHQGEAGVVILDASGKAPDFASGHIPGAVFTDFGQKDGWRVDKKVGDKKVVGLLPDVPHLEKLIGGLGIGNDDHVVVVSSGKNAADFGAATRIYWTFKVLGHDNVSVLNGGMAAYLKDKANPLVTGMATPQPKMFKARFNPAVLATTEDVKAALQKGTPLIDSRPEDQYLGINKSGAVQAYGTLPGAINVPAVLSTVNGGGSIRSTEGLGALYAMQKASSDGEVIAFCNTGHWASLGWFINSEMLGNKKTRMYDGSMTEWTSDPAAPMVRRVKLD